jgi:hypothetical protein
MLKGLARWAGGAIPQNLLVFFAAILLSNCVNVFTTIYAVPGHPVRSLSLICSCVASLLAAGCWTGLAAKKDRIEKALVSGYSDPHEREEARAGMWEGIWFRATLYFGGGIVFSVTALLVLVFPLA